MASLCKRQQCTIERRGFRQELDSWRHKLVHCVGFESILEGLFGPGLIEDLKLFKDCEPEAVSDWSFDENCLFCCLRRDKVKEHLVGLSNQGLEDTPKPLLLKDQTKINRLEKQAEEFLNAVLSRKDVPNFSDPGIPVVARELMQRMIRQFAAEYTSKTSSSQDSLPDPQPGSVQSLPCPPLFAGVTPSTSPGAPLAAAAHNQNPVLSKLLMADQDAPLDLTIKKPLVEPTEQEGVLDLSLKKNRYSSSNSSLSGLRPYHSPNTSTLKGESPEMHAAKDLQSTSMLEQFMAKLCPHHQRQIVDTLGFLQTEVKALASSSSSQTTYYTSENQEVAPSSASSSPGTSKKSSSELRFPLTSTPKGQEMSLVIPSNFSIAKKVPDGSVSLKPSDIAGPAFDLNTFGLGSEVALVNQNLNTSDSENSRHNDHAPLKMKIMKTNKLADGKKLACVLTTSLLTQSDGMQERQGNSDSSNKTEPHSARLSSSAKRPNQSGHTHQVKNRDPLGQTKDTPTKTFTIHRTSNTLLQDSPRTARKTIRGSSDHRTRDPAPRVIVDPDLGHCDIVYIDKPITECLREQQHHMPPRRNARKSTRGHMYVEEMWELKTVRTLAGRNERGNCPNPMPEINTLVTPKQVLAKPDGVPPVDMPFAGDCGQTIGQQMPSEESDEREIPGTGDVMEATTTELDLIVETSQTDQSKVDDPSSHHSTLSSPTENGEENLNEDIVQDETTDSIQTGGNELSEEIVLPSSHEAVKEKQELDEDPNETTEHVVAEKGNENDMMEESQPQLISDTSEPEQQQKEDLPAVLNTAQEEVEEKESEPTEDEEPLKPQVEAPKLSDNLSAEKNSGNTAPAEEIVKEQQIDTVETVTNVLIPVAPVEIKEDYRSDDEYDVSTKTLESLLKELPPWRRKRGTVISLPKRLREAKNVIVGYVNGRPISASDRSLRRRSSNGTSPPPSTSVKPRRSMSKISSAENTPSKKHLHLEKGHIKSETVIPQETEETPETPQTTESEHPTMSSGKQITNRSKAKAKRNRVKTEVQSTNDTLPATLPDQTVDSSKSIESEQQTTESPLSAEVETQVAANANTSASPRRLTPSSPLFTGDAPPLPVSSTPLCVVAPPLMSSSQVEEQSPQTSSEQSQQCMNPERTVELSIAYAHSADTPPDEIKITEVESIKQTEQKHSSINVPVEINKDEKLQVCNEVSCPLESQNLIGNEKETQGTPLRSRTLRKEETSELALKKSEEETMDDKPSGGVSNCTSVSDKPVRMPLRSESSKVEMLNQSLTQPAPIENMKPALRSQRFATPSTSEFNVAGKHKQIVSPIRRKPVVIHRSPVKSPSLSVSSMSLPSSVTPFSLRPIEPHRQTAHKLIETLNGEDNQQLITNLNIKFDKMQKGWIQMDKEGHPATKYRNKADRQAAIWKSKRRARKPKCIEHHKYSPVQMLFMKNFNLTSICRWFLESTETKSLVIVKKVNTRLPSETQLCFHSSSGMSGTSDGVFPSLQAERLKKHLKKFAVASPVKSNPKSQKLIAKAFEQEAVLVKGKDRGELPNPTLTDFASAEAQVLQLAEVQKVTGKSKNPASARILRKYSNIREKMQVQQTSVRLKETTKSLKRTTAFKKLTTSKSSSKAHVKSPLKTQKTPLPVPKQMKEPAATMARGKTTPGRKTTAKPAALEKKVKSPSTGRASKDLVKKESDSPQRCSQRLGSPKTQKSLIQASTSKVYSNKNQPQTEKTEVEKLAPTNPTSTKSQIKESSQNKVAEGKGVDKAFEMPQQSTDTKTPSSPDQVLTRSQKKLEAMLPVNASPTPGSRKALKSIMSSLPNSTAKKAMGLKVTRSATPKSVAIKGLTSPASRRVTKKLAAKRRLEPLETPAKRTRMSQLK